MKNDTVCRAFFGKLTDLHKNLYFLEKLLSQTRTKNVLKTAIKNLEPDFYPIAMKSLGKKQVKCE